MNRPSGSDSGPVTVAIVNTNPDLVKIMRFYLEGVGFVVFEIHIDQIRAATADIDSFLEQHDPRVIVYDVAPPYENNWNFMEHLRKSTGMRDRKFVLTSMNERRVRELVNTDDTVYEVVGHEEDMMQVVRAVKEASRSRRTR